MSGNDRDLVFAALGDTCRRLLLDRLRQRNGQTITALAEGLAITRQAVTKHLNVLEEAGLVASSRIGRESRYSFQPETLDEIRAYLDEVSRQWDDTLGRLKSFVEG